MNRNELAIKGSVVGIGYQMVSMITKFIVRTYAIRIFGKELLGLDSVLIDMISTMCIIEGSVISVMQFRLYSPIAKGEQQKVNTWMAAFRYMYVRIGVLILFLGGVLSLFLPYVIKTESVSMFFVYISFYLQLFNMVISYWIGYHRVLLSADQKKHICMLVDLCMTIVFCIAKLISVICMKNYLMFLFLSILQNVAANLILQKYFKNKYPYINWKSQSINEDVKGVLRDAKDAFSDGLVSSVYGCIDGIVISTVMGTAVLGIFSNYKYISTTMIHIVYYTMIAIQPIIGNYLNSNYDAKSTYQVLKKYTFIRFIMVGITAVAFATISDTFVMFWTGNNEYIMSHMITLLLVVDYYIVCLYYPLYEYVLGLGMFRYGKYVAYLGAITNMIFSIVGVYMLGCVGVLIATVISHILMWVGYIYIVFRINYSDNPAFCGDYLSTHMKYIIVMTISICLSMLFYKMVYNYNIIINLIAGLFISVFIFIVMMYVSFRKTSEYAYVINVIKMVYHKFQVLR